MTCHNGRPGPPHNDKECYSYLAKDMITAATYTNTTNKFQMVIGIGFLSFTHTDSEDEAWVTDPGGKRIASIEIVTSSHDAPASGFSAFIVGDNIRLLVPPSCVFHVESGSVVEWATVIQCATLDHALDLL